ncbi:Serine/threonine exchanger SteT [Phycisphaerae bacterium RAS1]|nr:Serine/threonine exchanger SteT [Phycisphaerae bacterium RAS1]
MAENGARVKSSTDPTRGTEPSSPASTQAAVQDQPDGLKRVLGPLDATAIVIGAIIGVGIFFTPSTVAKLAGSGQAALLAWALGGAIALAGGLTFARLGAICTQAGGQYEVLRDALGPLPAFVFVFCNATAIQAGAIAIIAMICAMNLHLAIAGEDASPSMTAGAAIRLIAALAAANVVGVRTGAGVQNATVLARLAAVALIVVLAAAAGGAPAATAQSTSQAISQAASSARAQSPAPPAFWSMLVLLPAAIVPSFFAYGGWQHALWIGGEIRNPSRNVPLAIVVGVVTVIIAYVLINAAYLRLLGYEGVASSRALAADAVGAVWPGIGRQAAAAMVAVSALGVLNAQLLSGPRLIYRMAEDGRFFALFSRLDPRFATPWAAVLLLAGLGIVLVLAAGLNGVDRLLTGVVFVDGVFFFLTGVSAFVLARRAASAAAPRFGYPLAPAIFCAGEAAIMIGAYLDRDTRAAAVVGLIWIAAAVGLYLARFHRQRRAG